MPKRAASQGAPGPLGAVDCPLRTDSCGGEKLLTALLGLRLLRGTRVTVVLGVSRRFKEPVP